MLKFRYFLPASNILNAIGSLRGLTSIQNLTKPSKRKRLLMEKEGELDLIELAKEQRRLRQALGPPKRQPDIRISKALSWVLRHGAVKEGLNIRLDGYVRVTDLLNLPKFRQLDFLALERIVQEDEKMRYHLLLQADPENSFKGDIWWIRANQGHSMHGVELDLKLLTDAGQVPMAVHGTTRKAWNSIEHEGLSRMKRNHIHLAQGVGRDFVISGMRSSSEIYIYLDLAKAMAAGIKFQLSSNGVILSEGNERGFISPQYFYKVTERSLKPLPGWEGPSSWNDLELSEDIVDELPKPYAEDISTGGMNHHQN